MGTSKGFYVFLAAINVLHCALLCGLDYGLTFVWFYCLVLQRLEKFSEGKPRGIRSRVEHDTCVGTVARTETAHVIELSEQSDLLHLKSPVTYARNDSMPTAVTALTNAVFSHQFF